MHTQRARQKSPVKLKRDLLRDVYLYLSHGPCDIAAFLHMAGTQQGRQRRRKNRLPQRPLPEALPHHLRLLVGVQEHVMAVLCELCSRPSVRVRLHELGGFAPIVTIAFQGVGGRNKTLAQQLIAKMAMSEVRLCVRARVCACV